MKFVSKHENSLKPLLLVTMAKRYIFPQQQGERKKAKLDVTISDHNFPLSQNSGLRQEADKDTWGDDNDDEILLLASQVCEQAYNNDISLLPDYSICMQPRSTSTQLCDPGPSTSKEGFTFKKPNTSMPNTVSTHLKNKCSTISSPLPGMSSKMTSNVNDYVNLDEIFNDKIYKGQDSDQIYRQLLQLQEENAKLKSENGKLLEKCVTKEGEASILRTQLKTCQVAVDNVRLEKIKAQEKVQMEWTEKLSTASGQIHDLRTQLDFKNLEIISIKEKCKKLESTKVKLTQVTVGNNDISSSHRNNNSILMPNDSHPLQTRRVKTTSSSAQTDKALHKVPFLRLDKSCRSAASKLRYILPLILEPTPEQHHNILDYNEKLQRHTDSHHKCRIYSTFHRLPSTPPTSKDNHKSNVTLPCIYGDLTCIAGEKEFEGLMDKYCNVFRAVKSMLAEVQVELKAISQRATTAFQKEMDERYIECTSTYLPVDKRDLLQGKILYKEEQALLARRMVAILIYLIDDIKSIELLSKEEVIEERRNDSHSQTNIKLIDLISGICGLLDTTSCATIYSGLLLSITCLIKKLFSHTIYQNKALEIMKSIIMSRPMPFVACELLAVLRRVSVTAGFSKTYCAGSSAANLKLDYDQGVLLYKKDSCYVQVLLKQIENCLKCIERQNLREQAIEVAQNLMGVYINVNVDYHREQEKSRCDCRLVLIQVIVYALRICTVMMKNHESDRPTVSYKHDLLATCRSGVHILYQCISRDVEFGSQLSFNEGHLIELCEILREYDRSELYGNMLTEIAGTFQSSPEDMPSSFHRQACLNSFKNFSLVD